MQRRRSGKRAEPRIQDPRTHPRQSVCLRVAAAYLDMNERTVRARIDSGDLEAVRDGQVYRIRVDALVRYQEKRAAAP